MENPETQATLGTRKGTNGKKEKTTTQKTKQMNNTDSTINSGKNPSTHEE